ncbi:PIN domain-containing protein [Sphingobacterium cavernae]|uniref:PIN domain-containing protein n=1 Tax=Sphingobacterium cavernae TaxID=2592657 RepID=UPI00122FCECE|nr:PIN domain-containing protein [Sphingobacterium cavernae]
MIYLLFDTNIWIYLANGFDPITKNKSQQFSEKLTEKLFELLDNNRVGILKSDIIIDEWQRNQINVEKLIAHLESKRKNEKKILEDIGRDTDPEISSKLYLLHNENVDSLIKKNRALIHKLNKIIESGTDLPLSIETKASITDWAIQKKAPFVGDKKNSTADAAIFFSMVDFSKKNKADTIIFVTSNKGDFSDKSDDGKLHPDLFELTKNENIHYFKNLGEAFNYIDNNIQFSRKELEDIQEEFDDFVDDLDYCYVCDPGEENIYLNFISYYNVESIENENEIINDPNQLSIIYPNLTEIKETEIIKTVKIGQCTWCGSYHINCQSCSTTIPVANDSNITECECGIKYYFDYGYGKYKNGECYEIKIIKDIVECRQCGEEIEDYDFYGDEICELCTQSLDN